MRRRRWDRIWGGDKGRGEGGAAEDRRPRSTGEHALDPYTLLGQHTALLGLVRPTLPAVLLGPRTALAAASHAGHSLGHVSRAHCLQETEEGARRP